MHTTRGAFVDVTDGYLYYETSGEGPDVVLLGAGGADVRMWDTTVAWLAETHRVTTIDYRNTGLSSRATGPYAEVEDLRAVLVDAGVERAVVIGCSDGGRRALAFAHQHPEMVRQAVVVGASFGDFPEPTAEEVAARTVMREHFERRARALAEGGPPAAAAVDIDGWGPALDVDDRRRMIGYQLANRYFVDLEDYQGVELEPPLKTRLREVAVPVSVLVGEHDFASTLLWARRMAVELPDARLEVLSGADHFPMLSRPTGFRTSVLRALERG